MQAIVAVYDELVELLSLPSELVELQSKLRAEISEYLQSSPPLRDTLQRRVVLKTVILEYKVTNDVVVLSSVDIRKESQLCLQQDTGKARQSKSCKNCRVRSATVISGFNSADST